ncbi:MAG: sel1 repeat family protein, partial [Oscillospiraceae bacterium]|nr:sel1 repeat family protein [Oscillospiraceae bacterium]
MGENLEIKNLEAAAEQGDMEAQYNLGHMYYDGEGTEMNYEKALYWWEKAAEQGDADAQFNLG